MIPLPSTVLSHARRRGLPAVVALALVAFLLPVVTTLASLSGGAAALPVDDVVFSEGHIDAGNYNLHDNPTAWLLEDDDNFGPTGTYEINSVTLQLETANVTPTYLSTVHVFFDGWVWNGDWDQAELDAIEEWVAGGGVLIANEDHTDADDLGATFGLPTTGSGVSTGVVFTPAAGQGAHPIVAGPFGTWASLASAGTTGWFDPVPAPWTVIAEDDLGRAVLVTRDWGDGHIILTADEAMFRPTLAGNDVSAGNILAFAIDLVDDSKLPLVVGDPGHQTTVNGETVSLQITVTQGNGSDVTYTVDQLPSGLSIDPDTGLITGDVDTLGSTTVEVTATPATGPADSVTFEWDVVVPLDVPETDDQTVVQGGLVSLPIPTTGGDGSNITFTADQLPSGLSIDPDSGLISGTADTLGDTTTKVTATPDSGPADDVTFDWTVIADGEPAATDDVIVGQVGETLSLDICGNDEPGNGPISAAAEGALPGGLAIADCELTGIPTAAGLTVADYEVTDTDGDTDTASIHIFVDPAGAPGDAAACRPDSLLSFEGGVPGAANTGDAFGDALATGDFNGDGELDLAVGAPSDASSKGSVVVFTAPCPNGTAQRITQAGDTPGANEIGDNFGAAIAAGDFDGDGYDDLAIGAPGEDTRSRTNDGNVTVLYGSAAGIVDSQGDTLSQRSSSPGKAQTDDRLGSALAAGDINGDGYVDLVVGVPGEDVKGAVDAGAAMIFYGSATGISGDDAQLWKQAGPLAGGSQAGDGLGTTVATGDLNGDGFDEAIFAAPYDDFAAADGGVVHVLPGTASGATVTGQRFLKSDGLMVRNGLGLAAGDVTGDGTDDLVIGRNDTTSAGAVRIYAGGPGGFSYLATVRQSSGTASASTPGDGFGSALAIADLDGDGVGELAIGASGETFAAAGVEAAGSVSVYDIVGGAVRHVDHRFRTQADADTAGALNSGAGFGATLAAGDGVVFVGAPDGDGNSVAGIGTVSAIGARGQVTTHLAPNCVSSCTEHEYVVGVDIAYGTYRTSQAAGGPCVVATVDGDDDQVQLTSIDGGTAGILQVTPDHETVIISTGCTGVWFFTSL